MAEEKDKPEPDISRIKECLPGGALIQSVAGKDLKEILQQAGLLNKDGQWLWYLEAEKRWRGKGDWTEFLLLGLSTIGENLLSGLGRLFVSAQGNWPAISGCAAPDAATAALVEMLIGFIRRWIADIPPSITRPWDTYSNWACPTGLPGPEWANEAYARNYVSEDDWKCLVRANGMAQTWQYHDVYMRGQKVSEDEIITLERRNVLKSITGKEDIPAAVSDELKTRGWIDPSERVKKWRSSEWVPSPSDAIEWMLKDVDDPQIQQTFVLDAEFKQKYQKSTKAALDANGISSDNALNLWRAHWRNMAPHTLYEMHKRLRPGWTELMTVAEVNIFFESICPRKPAGFNAGDDPRPTGQDGYKIPVYCDEVPVFEDRRTYLESLAVSGYHVFEALGQADYPAFWRPRLLALSYNVLTRVDARRAYETGSFSDAKLTAVLQDRGYSIGDAEALTVFYHKQTVQKFARSPAAKEWIQFPYPSVMLQENLQADGMRADLWDEVFGIITLKRRIYAFIQKMKQAKKNVTGGKQNRAQAVQTVAGLLKGM